jgi:protoporphyrinogen oxidase
MDIYIIGAGVSGLIAAYELERSGLRPIILEASDRVGGRIRTDEVDGFLLDRGFQVLLTQYPEAQRYLDYPALDLHYFQPGALLFKLGGNIIPVYDPFREPTKLLNMAFSPVGSLKDKFLLFKLTQSLKSTFPEKIFEEPTVPTLEFLKQYGFSDKIITLFFKPFFKGIFLETELNTSSRMFKFVMKMFAEGSAAVPKMGMQAIPFQLKEKLLQTDIRFNTKVDNIQGNTITLESGEAIQADKIIVATRPDKVLTQLRGQELKSKRVINLYFTLEKSFIASPTLGLVADDTFLINNMVFMTDVNRNYSRSGKALLSVSVVKNVIADEQLIKMVCIELEALTGIQASFFKLVKVLDIADALPDIEDVSYSVNHGQTKITDHVYLAGDYLLNGSINGAMTAGRKAAEAVIMSLSPTY